jgi:hypothetical protein
VSDALLAEQLADARDDIVRGHPGRLVDDEDAVRGAASLLLWRSMGALQYTS